MPNPTLADLAAAQAAWDRVNYRGMPDWDVAPVQAIAEAMVKVRREGARRFHTGAQVMREFVPKYDEQVEEGRCPRCGK